MKKLYLPFLTILLLLSCERNWNNLLSTDDDLQNTPHIIQINLDSEKNITIILNYAYSDLSSVILERRSVGGFETINYIRESQTTLTDTSFDKEISHNFVYRVSVTKDEHRSSYSDEKSFIFTSTGLNNPESLVAVSVELQGIRLEWNDKSNYEDSYIIEKDEGSGYSEIATLSPSTESYFDAIPGAPPSPLQLDYRVKAFSTVLESDWVGIATVYSGLGSPTTLRITNNHPWNFTIEWDDNSSIETGYLIEKKIDTGSFTQIAKVSANSTTYSDTITAIGTYRYRVRTKQNNIYSSYSNLVSQNITSLVPIDGLLAYYPFNGNANDESGNGNNGTVYGATLSPDRFGNLNRSYIFDNNNNDYISAPQIFLSHDFTISLWIYRVKYVSAASLYPYLTRNNGWNGFAIHGSKDDGRVWAGVNAINRIETNENVLVENQWIHLVFSRDNLQKLYKNSLFIYSATDVPNIWTSITTIGIGVTTSNNGWNGMIDDIRIYNRTLSNAEIQVLYHEGGWTK